MSRHLTVVAAVVLAVAAGCGSPAPAPPPPPAPLPSAMASAQPTTAVDEVPQLQGYPAQLTRLGRRATACGPDAIDVCKEVDAAAGRIAADVKKIVAARPDAARFQSVIRAADQLESTAGAVGPGCAADGQLCEPMRDLFSTTVSGLQLALVAPR